MMMLHAPQGPEWQAALAGLREMYALTRSRDEAAAREVAELEVAVYGPAPASGSTE